MSEFEVKKGERYDSVYRDNVIYTVTDVIKKDGRITVVWDCVGRKYWMKRVSIETIKEWIEDGRLVKI